MDVWRAVENEPYNLKFVSDHFKIQDLDQKNYLLDKENYRPVSKLPLLSKVYERAIFNQLSEYMQKVLNKIII